MFALIPGYFGAGWEDFEASGLDPCTVGLPFEESKHSSLSATVD